MMSTTLRFDGAKMTEIHLHSSNLPEP